MSDPATRLYGRDAEIAALDHLLVTARSGASGVLVVHGEAGIGKTALLEHVIGSAAECLVLRTVGVESDMELAYAGLQQLCAPVLDRAVVLPEPQRQAVEIAFGLRSGAAPDRFLVGLAVLGLLAAASEDRPVLCVVDDAQWLDRASALTLSFVARRLLAERVGVVFAQRDPVTDLAGLPDIAVTGLADVDARALLGSATLVRLDESVRDRIVTETNGNPLALWELPRDMTPAELAGGYHQPGTGAVVGQVEERFLRRIAALPYVTRRLLGIAAVEPVGDPTLLFGAADALGLDAAELTSAESAGLLDVDTRVRFRHPLVRAAAYRSATADERRAAHRALAEVTDADRDPDRRAWHRAHGAGEPDEAIAAELERSADRARVRGGIAAAAAFLTRATELTPDPATRGVRALAAAEAKSEAAAPEAAEDLLAAASLGPLDVVDRARVARLRARLTFARSRGMGSAALLLESVTRFVDTAEAVRGTDEALATETYLDAVAAAMYVGRAGGGLLADTAVAAARLTTGTRPGGLLTDALVTRLAGPGPTAQRAMAVALDAVRADTWSWQAFPLAHEALAHEAWDDAAWHRIAVDAVRIATESGALAVLPSALVSRAGLHLQEGEFATAGALVAEADEIARATGHLPIRYHGLALAAWTGDEAATTALLDAATRDGDGRGEGRIAGLVGYTSAVLYNGLGRYQVALDASMRAREFDDIGLLGWTLVELVEAATRAGRDATAAEGLELLGERTVPAGTDWALGMLARSRALLGVGAEAEDGYLEAIDRLGRTRIAVHLARARLLYGEWLRRENRRTDARVQLRDAHRMFTAMGAGAFADRARRELLATGEKAAKRSAGPGEALTAQERQIAELVAVGLTNPEIGAQLFISAHTVEWHLRKVFAKLAIRSRRELRSLRLP
ncbi:ATP-binding protein [Mycolicibacterium sediminis]|uniref:Putative transcriptional regulator, LuxR family protein n=1 Tax=Mycolicibacterium sediminis TaxID=1286180 RepID=A0A7I7QSZ1_9MYCO|nr:LuxR family transcriptional regulator [Mycolicibacterium sediminis]BBY29180.1 putative transcriptional regulator, LuxR family protein [Mycolicibacterium sediminis]